MRRAAGARALADGVARVVSNAPVSEAVEEAEEDEEGVGGRERGAEAEEGGEEEGVDEDGAAAVLVAQGAKNDGAEGHAEVAGGGDEGDLGVGQVPLVLELGVQQRHERDLARVDEVAAAAQQEQTALELAEAKVVDDAVEGERCAARGAGRAHGRPFIVAVRGRHRGSLAQRVPIAPQQPLPLHFLVRAAALHAVARAAGLLARGSRLSKIRV